MPDRSGRLAILLLLGALWDGRAAAAGALEAVAPLLQWRNLGPMLGGRSIAVGGSVARPHEYYFGATGGGLWKSTSGGEDWSPVTDGQIGAASVGAVGICQADPDVVYIGTGESQFRGTMSMGDGVYVTRDGAATWRHLGLQSSSGQTAISRVRVHPEDCDTVYVASMGDPFGPNEERGVYKSADGGASWSRVLYKNDMTGAAELVFDPGDPRVLYATLWDMERKPWVANSGGPDSGLYRTRDAGATWTDLVDRLPLPGGRIGKIGVSVSGADSDRVYALVEHDAGGLFRSDDAGDTWSRINGERKLIDRAEYYTRVFADPVDRERVYVNAGSAFFVSADAGATFEAIPNPHSDNHDLWIDPTNNERMIQSNDGGANVTVNGGLSWTDQSYSTAQIYHVTTIPGFPFHICGSQQDRTSVCTPIDGDGSHLFRSAAGEQGYQRAFAERPDLHVGGGQRGWLERLDRSTGQRKAIDVWPDSAQGIAPDKLRERFNWTIPIALSPQEPNVMYVASQHVWRSENYGESWIRISPDLSYADPATIVGEQSIVPNQNGQDYYATVFALAVSPGDKETIWAGSDDGLIHLTQDGGQTWQNVTPPGLPRFGRVGYIHASRHAPGRAYVAVDRYKLQDLGVYLYRTDDFGRSWTSIAEGVAAGHYARAVIEDSERSGLLFLGTEHGAYVSLNGGALWAPLTLNLPDVQVSDLEVRENTLVISTYGRGLWVLDDISLLRHLARRPLPRAGVVLFEPPPSVRSQSEPLGYYRRRPLPNLNNVPIRYWLGSEARAVRIEISDSAGRRLWEAEGDDLGAAGIHEVNWDLRMPPAREVEGVAIRGGGLAGPIVVPGEYTVTLEVDGEARSARFTVEKDPRLADVSPEDFAAQFALASRVHARLNEALDAVAELRRLAAAAGDEKRASALRALEAELYESRAASPAGALQFGVRLVSKLGILLQRHVLGADGKPTEQTYAAFDHLSASLDDVLARIHALQAKP